DVEPDRSREPRTAEARGVRADAEAPARGGRRRDPRSAAARPQACPDALSAQWSRADDAAGATPSRDRALRPAPGRRGKNRPALRPAPGERREPSRRRARPRAFRALQSDSTVRALPKPGGRERG